MNNGFIIVPSWARTELDLSGNELLVYSIIYGFSQDGETKFNGSRQYLADWCGISVRQVQNILNDLIDKNLISKHEETCNGIKTCKYKANLIGGGKLFHGGGENISPNNIEDNIDNINTNSINMGKPLSLLESAINKKSRKKNLYEKCVDEINEYTDDGNLRKCLVDYLNVRLAMKDKPLYGLNQWKGLLRKLESMSGNKIAIVNQSMERGWATFVEVSQSRNNFANNFGESDKVSCASASVDDYDVEVF